jgi:hypothetical protein
MLECIAAPKLMVTHSTTVNGIDDLYAALQRLAHGRVKIGLILQDSMFLNERKRIA